MSVKKISVAAAILFTLTACGSRGGHTDTSALTQSNKNLQAQVNTLKTESEQAKQKAELAQQKAEEAQQKVKQAETNSHTTKQEIEALKIQAELAKQQADQAVSDLKTATEKMLDISKTELNLLQIKADQATKRAELAEQKAQQAEIKNIQSAKEINILKEQAQLAKQEAEQAIAEAKKAKEIAQYALDNLDQKIQNALLKAELDKRPDIRKDLVALAQESNLFNNELQYRYFAIHNPNLTIDEAKNKLEKQKELFQLGQEKGLDEFTAKDRAIDFSFNNKTYDELVKSIDNDITNITFGRKQSIVNTLTIETPIGFSGQFEVTTVPLLDENGLQTGKTKIESYKDIYNQKYSVIYGKFKNDPQPTYTIVDFNGLKTSEKNLPTEGIATYQGIAFTANTQGKLNYLVDFGKKQGHGEITELANIGKLTLETGDIAPRKNKMAITGSVIAEDWKNDQVSGKYFAYFYGPKAEEIVGRVSIEQNPSYNTRSLKEVTIDSEYGDVAIGFGGTRGEIQK